jgi:hypothetical protein
VSYSKQTWANGSGGGTARNATRLNHQEDGIKEASDRLDVLETLSISAQTASYTLVLADAGKVVEVTSASATNVTVPQNSSVAFPVGTVIEVCQLGAGQVTIVQGTGATLRTANGLKLRAQYSSASLRKNATNTWVVAGDVTT